MPKQFHLHRGQAERTIRRAGELARILYGEWVRDRQSLNEWAKRLKPLAHDIFYIQAVFLDLSNLQGKKSFDDIPCPVCGEMFDRFCRKKYCSPKCKQKSYRQRVTKARERFPASTSRINQHQEEKAP